MLCMPDMFVEYVAELFISFIITIQCVEVGARCSSVVRVVTHGAMSR